MPRKLIYESKLLPGVQFESYNDAMEAEDRLRTREQESEAMEAIGKYTRTAEPAMKAAEQAGPDAWATAPVEDLQKISEGQVLREMYGDNPMALARGYGITSSTTEPAKEFMAGLKKESDIASRAERSPQGWQQRSEEWNTIGAMPEGNEKNAAIESYLYKWAPSVGYGASPKSIAQAVKKQEALIPGKATEAAVKATAGTRAKIETEEETKKGIPGSYSSSQYLAAGFAHRIEQSEAVLSDLFSKGFEPGKWYNMIKSADAADAIKNPQQRRYAQAMRTFINATLRRESGAAIAKSEFDTAYKQYFARLNADPETLAQKAETRARVLDAFKVEAGGAYEQVVAQQKKRQAETKTKEDKFKVGKIYKDASGAKAKYLGNGEWEDL